MRLQVIAALALLVAASPASAQDAGADWDLTEDPATGIVAASITFSNGVGIGLRCVNGRYDALIAGLPDAEPGAETRTVSLQFGDEDASEERWFVANTPGVVVSELPARLARTLREGGPLKVRAQEPGPQGRRMRYDLDLPASPVQIDRTLSACDKPTTDPRDAMVEGLGPDGLPRDVVWVRPPEPRYPTGRTFERGFVVISCLNRSDGRLEECVVESEFPTGGGFADEALRATRRAQIGLADAPDAPLPTRFVVYRTNFTMGSFQDMAEQEFRSTSRIRRPSSTQAE